MEGFAFMEIWPGRYGWGREAVGVLWFRGVMWRILPVGCLVTVSCSESFGQGGI